MNYKICILGGGFGGLYTAIYLSSFSWVKSGKCEITLVEPKDNFLFSPLLYEILTSELQTWEIAPSYQKLLRHTPIKFCQDRAISLDLQQRSVTLSRGEILNYDYLTLAVGGLTKFIDIPGLKDFALNFRSLADAELLKERLRLLLASSRQKLRLAIIGGGPNGVELGCKLADLLKGRGEIALIDRSSQLLKNFPQGVQKAAFKSLKKRQIKIRLQTNLQAITADSITLSSGELVFEQPVDLVLWTAGTELVDWIKNLDTQHDSQGKLLVKPTLQLLDYREVFALGDINKICSAQHIPDTAQAAYQQASCAAKNLRSLLLKKRLHNFHYLHLGDMLTLGKKEAIVSSFFLNISGRWGGFLRRLIYIFRLPTMHHRWQVLKNFFNLTSRTKNTFS